MECCLLSILMKRINNIIDVKNKRNLLVLALLIPLMVTGAPRKGRWSEEKANQWYYSQPWAVGCDYIVSNAINQIEMWQESTFSPELIDKELAMAEELGFNTVRLFLHDLVYEADPKGFKARIAQVLDICENHGIKVVMTFFTNGGKFDNVSLGDQPDPIPGVHNPEWRQTPGAQVVNDPSQWGRLEKYVKDILKTYKHDDRIYCWCIYNEPENDNRGANSLPLMREAFKWGWEVNPDQPLTAPYASLMASDDRSNLAIWGFLAENCDIMSFHCYNPVYTLMDKYINPLKKMNRPIICTECVGRPANTLFDMYAICKKENIGVLSFGLLDSKMQCKFHWDSKEGAAEPKIWFHDLFHADGTPYDQKEIDFIKQITADKTMDPNAEPQTVMVQRITMKGRNLTTCMTVQQEDGKMRLHIPASQLKDLKRITVIPDFGRARIGEDGYYALPDGTVCPFVYKDEKVYTAKEFSNPVLGVKTPRQMYRSEINGMASSVWVEAYRGAQEYYTRYIFRLGEAGVMPQEDIIIDFIPVMNETDLK